MRTLLAPGVNLDRVDLAAGLHMADRLGYGGATAQMVAEYALMRHSRGEEAGAEATWLSQFPHDLTSWKAILTQAIAHAEAPAQITNDSS